MLGQKVYMKIREQLHPWESGQNQSYLVDKGMNCGSIGNKYTEMKWFSEFDKHMGRETSFMRE